MQVLPLNSSSTSKNPLRPGRPCMCGLACCWVFCTESIPNQCLRCLLAAGPLAPVSMTDDALVMRLKQIGVQLLYTLSG
jgi:hypothetical protein